MYPQYNNNFRKEERSINKTIKTQSHQLDGMNKQKETLTHAEEHMERHTADENAKQCVHFGKQPGNSIPGYLSLPPNQNISSHRSCAPRIRAPLFITVKKWGKKSKCLTDE
jgi:hypothetical protein